MADNMTVAEISTRVAKLERTVQFLLERLQIEYQESPEALFPDVTLLKQQGKATEAMQLYRSKTGVGLTEAKLFVDSLKV